MVVKRDPKLGSVPKNKHNFTPSKVRPRGAGVPLAAAPAGAAALASVPGRKGKGKGKPDATPATAAVPLTPAAPVVPVATTPVNSLPVQSDKLEAPE